MSKNLFIAGLSYSTTSDGLKNHFSQIGNVVSCQVIMDKYTNQSKGFGFVEMSTEEEAAEAMKKLDSSELDGRNIVVKEARPREEHGRGGYNGGNGGNRNNYDRRDSRKRY